MFPARSYDQTGFVSSAMSIRMFTLKKPCACIETSMVNLKKWFWIVYLMTEVSFDNLRFRGLTNILKLAVSGLLPWNLSQSIHLMALYEKKILLKFEKQEREKQIISKASFLSILIQKFTMNPGRIFCHLVIAFNLYPLVFSHLKNSCLWSRFTLVLSNDA